MSLTAPVIPNAKNGKLGYFDIKNGIQVIVQKYDGAMQGDTVTLHWGNVFMVEKIINSADIDLPKSFNVSDQFPLSCLYDGIYTISYTISDKFGNINMSDAYEITISTKCESSIT